MFDNKNSIGAYPIAPLGMCPVRHCQIVIGFPCQNDCKEYRVKSIGKGPHLPTPALSAAHFLGSTGKSTLEHDTPAGVATKIHFKQLQCNVVLFP